MKKRKRQAREEEEERKKIKANRQTDRQIPLAIGTSIAA